VPQVVENLFQSLNVKRIMLQILCSEVYLGKHMSGNIQNVGDL